MSSFISTDNNGDKYYQLTGIEHDDIDALDELMQLGSFSYELFMPNKMGQYVAILDKPSMQEQIYDVGDYVTLYRSEDDEEWLLWQ